MNVNLIGKAKLGSFWLPVYETDTEYSTKPTNNISGQIIMPDASDYWATYLQGTVYIDMLNELPPLNSEDFNTSEVITDAYLDQYTLKKVSVHRTWYSGYSSSMSYMISGSNQGDISNEIAAASHEISTYYGNNTISVGVYDGNNYSPCLCFTIAEYGGEKYICLQAFGIVYCIVAPSNKVDGYSYFAFHNTGFVKSPVGDYPLDRFVLLSSTDIDIKDIDYEEDPFVPGGISGPSDKPPGTFDDTSDPIPDSSLPTLTMADTGFTRIYNPTLSQVQELAQYLWKTDNIFETLWNKIKQSFENPMDAMIAFNIVPVSVPDGGNVDFSIMYIPTGIELTRAATQFVDVDCGTVELKGYYGSALDYSPNTHVQCYLPYIGMIELNPDEVMNTTLQVKYRVDIVSGGCVAKILVDGNCLYQYSGHCSISVPFTASDFSSYFSAMLQVSALAVGAIAAGTGAALAEGSVLAAQTAEQNTGKTVKHTTKTTTERNPSTGRQITVGTVTTHTEVEKANETTEASFNGLSPQNIANTASAVMASKFGISHAGSFNGNTGYLGVRYPYLIITTPRQCLPASYQTMNGYPSMITLPLSECTGFTQVQQVQLSGMTATNPEQAEILQLLKEGVIL